MCRRDRRRRTVWGSLNSKPVRSVNFPLDHFPPTDESRFRAGPPPPARPNAKPTKLPTQSAPEDERGARDATLTAQDEPIILAEAMPAVAVSSLAASTLALFLVGIGLVLSGILRERSTIDVPWASAESDGAGVGGNICGDASTEASVPDPSGAPSAFGCTDFSSAMESVLSFDSSAPPSSSSLTAITAMTAARGGRRYGAVFAGDFAGMNELYGSVSLRAAFAGDAFAEEEEEGTDGDALRGPDVVDVVVEACTAGAAGEWGACEGGWQPVLFQVN